MLICEFEPDGLKPSGSNSQISTHIVLRHDADFCLQKDACTLLNRLFLMRSPDEYYPAKRIVYCILRQSDFKGQRIVMYICYACVNVCWCIILELTAHGFRPACK